MATIDDSVPQGSVMPDNLRSDTARASLEYKNQLKNAGDIYVGTGTKITNDEDGSKEIYVTEGKNIQKALNEDIFRGGGKNNIGLTNSDLSVYSNNIGIGKDISIIGNNNILIGNGAKAPTSNEYAVEYAVIIGDEASSLAGGITIGRNASSAGTNAVTIGDNAYNEAESGIVIGSAAATSTAVSGIALGGSALVKAPNAVQIGKGVNLDENSLQFHDTQIVGGDGHVNATKINGVLSTDIFENDKKTVKDATNVTGTIDGRLISSIFSGDTSIVQRAARLDVGKLGDEFTPVYFENGVPRECRTQILTVGSGRPFAGGPYAPGDNKVDLGSWDLFLNDYYYSITAIMATIDSNGKDTEVTKYEDWFSVSDLNNGRNKVITYKSKPYTLKVDNGELVFEGPADTIEIDKIAVRKYPIKCIRVFEIN